MNHLKTSDLRTRSAVSAFALALATFASPAFAQQAESSVQGEDDADIVVTGTLIRGVAPGGTNVVSVGADSVKASGASTTAQLLQSVPQLNTFGQLQFPLSSGSNQVTVNRPNLRSLPGFNTSGGSTTLVLLNGHRIVGMGISSTTPDPDFIPPGAIQRLEIVPDGGSAIYGSDAVAGVMNFITRRDFDGVEAGGHYGFADDYETFDANGTIGKKWEGGSAFVSYAYSQHDAIFGRDRDFVRQFPNTSPFTATGPIPTVMPTTCAPGNVVIGGNSIYGLPFTTATASAAAGKPNTCDLSDDATYYPKEHHHSVMAGFNQQLSDALSVDVSAYYFNREVVSNTGHFTPGAKSTTAATAGFAAHRVGTETGHTLQFAFGDRDAAEQTVGLESWGVTGEFTYRPGGDWRVRVMGNYGESDTEAHAAAFNDTALNNALGAGLFNPYDPAASNPTAYAAITNWETFGRSRQRLANFRAIADGSLFELPGGAVKLAVGAEYMSEGFVSTTGTSIPGMVYSGFSNVVVNGATIVPGQAGRPTFRLSRNTKAAFGELSVPLFGADNATTLFEQLTLSISGRYDKYSDFGDTFNPKIGVNWTPVQGLRLRGAWGKSFNAPSLADSNLAALTTGSYIGPIAFLPSSIAFFTPPPNLVANGTYPAFGGFQTILTIGGNAPGIQPQKAKTLSLGADVEPSFLPGLKFGGTYWRLRVDNVIGLAPFFDRNLWWNFYGSKITINPTDAQIAAALAQTNSPVTGTKCFLPSNCVYAILDTRKINRGDVKVAGIDFYLNYRTDTGFGGLDFALNGTYELERKESAARGSPFNDLLGVNNNTFRFSATAGADVGNLRAQATWFYREGYKLVPVAPVTGQARVGDYNVFNLFFKYDVPSDNGMLKDLSFTLNVDNVFDQDPPLDTSTKSSVTAAGYGNGQTLGRLFQFGVSKKF